MGKEDSKLRSRTKHKKKTKFEEYLDMEMGLKNPGLSAEEDLKLQRRLAKKLKVKAGKLRGVDDGMNVLFEGLSSFVEETENKSLSKKRKSLGQARHSEIESAAAVEASDSDVEVEKTSKKNKRRKKKKKNQDLVTDETDGCDSMPVESPCAEVAVDKVPVKAQKYVAPNLRLRKGNEPEDHVQLRRRVRGNVFEEIK